MNSSNVTMSRSRVILRLLFAMCLIFLLFIKTKERDSFQLVPKNTLSGDDVKSICNKRWII